MTERFSMVVRKWRSAEVMNDYVFRGINRRNLPRREREGEKFLHHLNFVRVSGINIHRFHRSNLQWMACAMKSIFSRRMGSLLEIDCEIRKSSFLSSFVRSLIEQRNLQLEISFVEKRLDIFFLLFSICNLNCDYRFISVVCDLIVLSNTQIIF